MQALFSFTGHRTPSVSHLKDIPRDFHNERIVGGTDASRGEFPWQVILIDTRCCDWIYKHRNLRRKSVSFRLKRLTDAKNSPLFGFTRKLIKVFSFATKGNFHFILIRHYITFFSLIVNHSFFKSVTWSSEKLPFPATLIKHIRTTFWCWGQSSLIKLLF